MLKRILGLVFGADADGLAEDAVAGSEAGD